MIRRCASVLAAAAIAFAAGSCRRDQGPGGPGSLRVRLSTSGITLPSAGLLFTVQGPEAPSSATPGSGLQLYQEGLMQTTKFVVLGPLTNNATVLTIHVSDRGQPYTATIQQIAGAGYQLEPLTGYGLTVVP